MKSIQELKSMLVAELLQKAYETEWDTKEIDNYNELLGNTSFLLVALLELNLRKQASDWPAQNWMDDSLITKVKLKEGKIVIEGLAIWGKGQLTEQWVEPFIFEMQLDEERSDFADYGFLFSDLDNEAIPYSFFSYNRSYWQSVNRNWRYRIKGG